MYRAGIIGGIRWKRGPVVDTIKSERFSGMRLTTTCLVGDVSKLDVGLEQPNANWAKRGRTMWRPGEERLPGRLEVIAHYAQTESYQHI